jgi:hypothetical protein
MNNVISKKYDLIVCTCDAYEDTWFPFFTLLKKYWPGAEHLRIILTTELKDFVFPGLAITCAKAGKDWRGRSQPWGKTLLASLKLVEAPLSLFMLDDFFINRTVHVDLLNSLADKMIEHKWDTVELIPQGNKTGLESPDVPCLVEIDIDTPYRVNTQAALWRPAALRQLLKTHESPWQFETRGTVRARKTGLRFMRQVNNCHKTAGEAIISYAAGGGLVRGKWKREDVVDLFTQNCIEVNYLRRGFWEPKREEQSTARRTGVKKVFRKDLLSLTWRLICDQWSLYRSR